MPDMGTLAPDMVTLPSRSGGPPDGLAHVIRREGAQAAIDERRPVEAWCGKVWVPMMLDPKGLPVCIVCMDLASQHRCDGGCS